MALIEVFTVSATNLPIDAASSTNIPQGSIVSLGSDGNVALADGDAATTGGWPLGIAGDSRSTGITSFTPESGSALSRNPTSSLDGALVIGAGGAVQRYTQNRVADNYNEVLASGLMTVYHSGGEFWTDQYEITRSNGSTACSYTPATPLYCSGAESADATHEPEGQRIGRWTDEVGTANTPGGYICGFVLTAPVAYPSGVPGTDVDFRSDLASGEGGNSLSFGTFLHVKNRL